MASLDSHKTSCTISFVEEMKCSYFSFLLLKGKTSHFFSYWSHSCSHDPQIHTLSLSQDFLCQLSTGQGSSNSLHTVSSSNAFENNMFLLLDHSWSLLHMASPAPSINSVNPTWWFLQSISTLSTAQWKKTRDIALVTQENAHLHARVEVDRH